MNTDILKNLKVKVVALTGGVASGKTTVARYWQSLGAGVVDADKEAHQLYENDDALVEKIAETFGEEVIDQGKLNRTKLGQLVFGDWVKLEKLNQLVRIPLWNRLLKALEENLNQGFSLVVLDAPLIFEWDIQSYFDCIVWVRTPAPIRVDRMMRRNGWNEAQALQRIDHQMNDLQILQAIQNGQLYHYIIDNVWDEEELKRRALEVWKELIS